MIDKFGIDFDLGARPDGCLWKTEVRKAKIVKREMGMSVYFGEYRKGTNICEGRGISSDCKN